MRRVVCVVGEACRLARWFRRRERSGGCDAECTRVRVNVVLRRQTHPGATTPIAPGCVERCSPTAKAPRCVRRRPSRWRSRAGFWHGESVRATVSHARTSSRRASRRIAGRGDGFRDEPAPTPPTHSHPRPENPAPMQTSRPPAGHRPEPMRHREPAANTSPPSPIRADRRHPSATSTQAVTPLHDPAQTSDLQAT